MSIGVFSEIQQKSVPSYTSNGNVSVEKNTNKAEKTKKAKLVNTIKTAAPIIIPLAAIPITAAVTYKISNKNVQGLKNQIKNLSGEIEKLQKANSEAISDLSKGLNKQSLSLKKTSKQLWAAVIAAAGVSGSYTAGRLSSSDKAEITDALSSRVSNIENNSNTARYEAEQASALIPGSLSKKYLGNINGILLLQNNATKNDSKYNAAVEAIQSASRKYLFNEQPCTPITTQNPTIWSVTSEFAPIKEGGLGCVPVDIQKNGAKLGVNIPTFVPMYQNNGNSVFNEVTDKDGTKYTYTYGTSTFHLKKAGEYKVEAFRNGKSETENVEIFVADPDDPANNAQNGNAPKRQLIFIKNDRYFNGKIYSTGEKTEEAEKFAFFSKAVYELAKAKFDEKSVKGLRVTDKSVFDSIKAPEALILNDWQASPIAALSRFKAPMENAYGELNDSAAKKLSNMNIITIGHNAMYQGSTRDNNDNAQRKTSTSNILNTLFDNYAYDVVINAKTGASDTDPNDYGLRNLDNMLIMNMQDSNSNHTNLLNMGICLSNYFHPVSENYASEIISDKHPELSGELRWALNQKNNAGALAGIINGNDFNALKLEAKRGFIKKLTGLQMREYSQDTPIDDIMAARAQNKIDFYNKYMLKFVSKNNPDFDDKEFKKMTERLELVNDKGNTNLPKLTDEELLKTPIIASVGRLVSQKGINVMADAIALLMKNWETDFPGKNKPIFYIGGEDGEGGVQKKYITDLKNSRLNQEDSNRVVFAHGFAPMAPMTASADFFLLPSIFEPCGLTQGESFALATPVIASAVGGIVDTVNRDGKHNGILTPKADKLTADDLYEAMKKGLKIFFDNPEKYKDMVKDSISEDFSWIQPGKKGPMFDYLKRLGVNVDSLKNAA